MFFIMGISQGQKKLDFDQLIICANCGKYGHLEVYMVYSYLSLFFIPVFKWGKTYYVRTTCCNTTVSLNQETGRQIARGELTSLPETIIKPSSNQGTSGSGNKKCAYCGYETTEDFQYCPKCGRSL